MSLKLQSDKAPLSLPILPAWGDLADAGQPVSVVVIECSGVVYSYPYHTLSRWVLTQGATDTLRVQAGGDEVTIQGRNLKAISDALGNARLRLLRIANDRYNDTHGAVVVCKIHVENKHGS